MKCSNAVLGAVVVFSGITALTMSASAETPLIVAGSDHEYEWVQAPGTSPAYSGDIVLLGGPTGVGNAALEFGGVIVSYDFVTPVGEFTPGNSSIVIGNGDSATLSWNQSTITSMMFDVELNSETADVAVGAGSMDAVSLLDPPGAWDSVPDAAQTLPMFGAATGGLLLLSRMARARRQTGR
jgi:hypothetical protein